MEKGWINWEELLARGDDAGNIESALAQAAHRLAQGDPGPAFGLMLVFPAVEVFQWGHAAGVLYLLIDGRNHHHPFLG